MDHGPFENELIPRSVVALDATDEAALAVATDGDVGTATHAQGRTRFRVTFGTPVDVAAIGVFAGSDGALTVSSTDQGATHALDGLDGVAVGAGTSARWSLRRPSSTRVADAVVVEWSPRSAEAPLPEFAFFAHASAPSALPGEPLADQIVAGSAHPALDVAATPEAVTISTPAALDPAAHAQQVQFTVDVAPASIGRAFLVYELTGLPHWTAALREINGAAAQGGFDAIAGSAGGVQAEEISPASLVRGTNTVHFLPADRSDVVGYTVRGLRLVAFSRGAAATSEAAVASTSTSGDDDPRTLIDGNLSTATVRRAAPHPGRPHARAVSPSRGYALAFDSDVQPLDVQFHVARTLVGSIDLDTGAHQPHVVVPLDHLAVGWHHVAIDSARLPTRNVRVAVHVPGESTGLVSEVHVDTAPVPAPAAGDVQLRIFSPVHGECVAHEGVSLRGEVVRRDADLRTARIVVDGDPSSAAVAADGTFDVRVPDPAAGASRHIALRVEFADGAGATKVVPLDPCSTEPPARAPSANDPVDDVGAPFGAVVHAGEARVLTYGDVALEVPTGSVHTDTRVTIRPLASSQLPPLDDGMTNVTPGGRAFRFGPLHERFDGPVRMALPYDASLFPSGMDASDVKLFYFDEVSRRWSPVRTVRAAAGGSISAVTSHFTDFIAATIASPEHPGMTSFNPNTIRDVRAADPSTGVDIIAPPTANSGGTANLSYPISIPAGRAGMTPSVGISYSSAGANGWMGVGWNLDTPHIEIDTRWGVPVYNGQERYLLNGDELVPINDASVSGVSLPDVRFLRRVEGAFDEIIRHGSGPSTYWWEINNRTGVRSIYGNSDNGVCSTGNAALASPRPEDSSAPPIFRWNLACVDDGFGNRIAYQYQTLLSSSVSGYTGEPWVQLYPFRIQYTQFCSGGRCTDASEGSGSYYAVNFTWSSRQRQVPNPWPQSSSAASIPWGDTSSNARAGFDIRTTQLLDTVTVQFVQSHGVVAGPSMSTVRSYQFAYGPADFGKWHLASIASLGRDGDEMYRHTFDYYSTALGDGMPSGFGTAVQTWNAAPDSGGGVVASPGGALHDNASLGFGVQGYAGIAPGCYVELGLNGTFAGSVELGGRSLIDADGDGLPDLVDSSSTAVGGTSVQLNRVDRSNPLALHAGFRSQIPLGTGDGGLTDAE